MVASLVDHGIHRITVFDVKGKIRLHLLSWIESRQASAQASRKRTITNVKDSSSTDDGDAELTGDQTTLSSILHKERR